MRIMKPPADLGLADDPVIFLAGSIEQDTATNWQKIVENGLQVYAGTILNPRRDAWDASWKQTIDSVRFREQVEWELGGMERARTIALYFEPGTKSPVTMLELGLHARAGKLIVCCPEGFWRKGNVDIVCRNYGIDQVNTLDDLILSLRSDLG